MSPVPQELVDTLTALVSNEDLPVLKKVEKLFECLKKSGFGYKTLVLPKETLTHPSNRGGSLLNVTDVWQKGMRMLVLASNHPCCKIVVLPLNCPPLKPSETSR